MLLISEFLTLVKSVVAEWFEGSTLALKVPGLKELVRSYSFKTLSAHLAGKGYPGQQGEGGEEGECPPS